MKKEDFISEKHSFKYFTQEVCFKSLQEYHKNWVFLEDIKKIPYDVSIYKWVRRFPIHLIGYEYEDKFYILKGNSDYENIKICVEKNKPFILDGKETRFSDFPEEVKKYCTDRISMNLMVINYVRANENDEPLDVYTMQDILKQYY